MPHQFSGNWFPSLAERFQSKFQVDGIPKGDGGDDQVEATGPVVLMFEAAVPHLSQSVGEHRSGQGVPGLMKTDVDQKAQTRPFPVGGGMVVPKNCFGYNDSEAFEGGYRMVASSKRSLRVFALLAVLVFVGSFFLAAQPDTSENSLEALISGTTSDAAAVLSALKDEDLPLALSAAEVLKFKSLHGDGRVTLQDAESFRSAVEQKIKEAKTVSLAKTEICTVAVPQRKAMIAGQEIIIPAHFRAPEPLRIVETKPDGEAGTIFPENA